MASDLSTLLSSLFLSDNSLSLLDFPSIRLTLDSEAEDPYNAGRLYKTIEQLAQHMISGISRGLIIDAIVDAAVIFLESKLADGSITMDHCDCMDYEGMAIAIGGLAGHIYGDGQALPDWSAEDGYGPIEKVVLAALKKVAEETLVFEDVEEKREFQEGYLDG